MDQVLPVRLLVRRPPPGVQLRVQRGRAELVAPSATSVDTVTFDLQIRVVLDGSAPPRLRGAELQGPPAGRFVYVNSGTRAGQPDSPWDRRAKVSLAGLTSALLMEAVATPGAVLIAEIEGTSRDGGPSCATVPLLGGGWRVLEPDP